MTDEQTAEVEPTPTKTEVVNPYPVDLKAKLLGEGGMPQIHRAMFAAKREIPSIAKNGVLELGGKEVPFTKVEDIRKALYPVLEKHGIMVYLQYVEGNDELQVAQEPMGMMQFADELDAEGKKTGGKLLLPSREVRDGKIPTTRYWSTVIYDIQFIFVGDNSGAVVRVKGMAYDTNSDKAVGKATTAAIKRAFTETFDIVDGKELDENESDDDPSNRSATTDRREGGDRGSQARAAAQTQASTGTSRRSGPQKSASTRPSPAAAQAKSEAEQAQEETGADPATGELPEPQAAPERTRLDTGKRRVREAVAKLKELGTVLQPAEVDAIATEVTGHTERAGENGWITKVTAVEKLAAELESRVKAKIDSGLSEFQGGE